MKKTRKVCRLKLGDNFVVKNKEDCEIICKIRHLNAGIGFLFPIFDDPEDPSVASHICYAKIDEQGNISVI